MTQYGMGLIRKNRLSSPAAALLVAAAGIVLAALPAGAAEYPAQPIRIIVGFAPGGAPDTLARVVGENPR